MARHAQYLDTTFDAFRMKGMSPEEFSEFCNRPLEDHDKNCFLQPPMTIPAWCTCNTYRESRIQTIVDLFFGRKDWAFYPYADQLQYGELREALERIRDEIQGA